MRTASRERGATSLEYAGMIGVAALVVAAVALGITQSGVGATVSCAVQRVLTQGGSCESGPPVTYADPSADEAPVVEVVDQRDVDEALASVRDSLDGGWNGVRSGELEDIEDVLAGLNGAELDAVIADMSDDELRQWVDELDDGWFGSGWGYEDRRDLWSMLAAKASLDTLDRLSTITGEIQPAFDEVGGDSAAENPDSPANAAEWTDLEHELFVGDPDDPDAPAVSPTDLNQGSIGDCWYIATLGALAQQQPALIEEAITANTNGTYTVRLYDGDGDPVYVTVSPDVPGIDGDPVFAQNPDGDGPAELWPHLMEKAAATYFGDYTDIEGDWPSTAMGLLTGKDIQTSKGDDPPAILDLASTMSSGGIILVSTAHEDRTSLYTDGTLVQGHAYYVQSIDDRAGTVTVVNPWGLDDHPPITMTTAEFLESFVRYDVAEQ